MSRSRTWTLGTVAVVLVVFVAGWFLVISPKRSEVKDLQASAADTVAQNVSAESTVNQLRVKQKDVPAQQASIESIKQQIPETADQPGLIRQLSVAADVTDVDLTAITPTPPAPLAGDPGVTYMATAITVQGSYANLKLFLDRLERNKRAIVVTGFSISQVQGGESSGDLSMAIQTRVFIGSIADAGSADTTGTSAAGTTGTTTTPGTGTTGTGNAG